MLIFRLSLCAYGVCLASGVFPLINAEFYLLTASAASPSHGTLPVLPQGTVGRFLRFAAFVVFPEVLKGVLP